MVDDRPSPIEGGSGKESILRQWLSLSRTLGLGEKSQEVGRELIKCYEQPHRCYHNLQHLDECLEQARAHSDLALDLPAVEVAIFFHDAVYVIGDADNEQRSADMARKTLMDLGLRTATVAQIAKMVLATTHKFEPPLGDARLVCDCDLAILASPRPRYDEYARQIEAEAGLPPVEFRPRRAQFLRVMLEKPTIFWTPQCRAELEGQARANMQNEVQVLLHG